MRIAALSTTAWLGVNRPEKKSLHKTMVKMGIELQIVENRRLKHSIFLQRFLSPAA